MKTPWLDEPTRRAFDAAGMPCRLERRSVMHQWRGYVGLAKEHPCHSLDHDGHLDEFERLVEGRRVSPEDLTFPVFDVFLGTPGRFTPALAFAVHGGISYSGDRLEDDWPDGLWWYGWDAGHHLDFQPWLYSNQRVVRELLALKVEWRDVEYAESETRHLAEQLADFAVEIEAARRGNSENGSKG